MKNHEILYPDTDYTNLVLKWGKTQMDVFSKDKDGDIMIDITDSYGNIPFYLDQEGIKLLIEHLKNQII